jgi:hypothetical protein
LRGPSSVKVVTGYQQQQPSLAMGTQKVNGKNEWEKDQKFERVKRHVGMYTFQV